MEWLPGGNKRSIRVGKKDDAGAGAGLPAAVRLQNPKTAAMEINAILADPQILWRMRAASAAAGQPHAATDIATRILGKVRHQAIPSHRHARLDQRIMH